MQFTHRPDAAALEAHIKTMLFNKHHRLRRQAAAPLPFLGAGSMGTGAALGSFVTALITGAPRWLGRWQ
jgi:hypothetical protein